MDRVFLDANVLFSAAYDSSRRVGSLWQLSAAQLITTPYAAAEALRNMARKFPDRLSALSKLLSQTGLVPEASSSALPDGVTLPPNDVPILMAAIEAKATHLLTGDRHFGPYFGKTIAGVTILLPGEYLRIHGE